MLYTLGHSTLDTIAEAVEEACRSFPEKPELVLFFSDGERFSDLTEALHLRYPLSTVIGASTYASFSPDGMCRRGLNATALSDGIHVSAGLVREITRNPGMIYQDMVQDALARLPSSPERGSICCFVLNPAGTASEEAVLDMLDEALSGTGIPVFGGSASSEVCARGSVSLNGGAYSSSSVFVLMQLAEGCFRITQENIFRPMGRQFRVTKANLARRTLYELDGQPAADVLCGAMNVQKDALAAALAQHPFGLALDGQLLINEVERVNPDGSITAYCRFFEGSTVSLLEPREFAETMDETLRRLHAAMPHPEFTVAVNCYSRTQMYLGNGWMNDFTDKMAASLGNYMGLTSHGEQLGKYQLNLTLLLLSMGKRPLYE